MRNVGYAAGILAVLQWTSFASAASLTNRDNREHQVTILEKAQASVTRALKPEETLQGICPKGCIVRLDGSERHEFIVEGDESLSIEGGEIFLDGVEPKPAPDQTPKEPPAPPKSR
jgi:hypothetical protein